MMEALLDKDTTLRHTFHCRLVPTPRVSDLFKSPLALSQYSTFTGQEEQLRERVL